MFTGKTMDLHFQATQAIKALIKGETEYYQTSGIGEWDKCVSMVRIQKYNEVLTKMRRLYKSLYTEACYSDRGDNKAPTFGNDDPMLAALETIRANTHAEEFLSSQGLAIIEE